MKNWMRIFCIMLALLLLPVMPLTDAAGAENNAPDDFVILLDCSGSLAQNDPDKLCLEAFKNFMDKLPMENARVTVICFGYEGKDYYDFSDRFNVPNREDKPLVHVIVKQSDLGDTAVNKRNKEAVIRVVEDNWVGKETSRTPIGHALAAAVEMMEKSGAKDDKACFILVTDGIRTSNTTYQDANLVEDASDGAGKHNWPVYCIELNYGNKNQTQVSAAAALLDKICNYSGNKRVGRQPCMNAEDVYKAYQTILHDFYGLDDPIFTSLILPGRHNFTIPMLASEATVDVWGAGLKNIRLIHNGTGKTWNIGKSEANDELVVVAEEGRYYSIKILRPMSGEWTLEVDGDQNASVLLSNIVMQNTEFGITVTQTGDANALTKLDSISVKAAFNYRNIIIRDEAAYSANPATLMVEGSDGKVRTYPMEATADGYFYTLPLKDLPSGEFTVYAVVDLKSSVSSVSERTSERVIRTLENQRTEWTGVEFGDQHVFVNGKLDRIDLTQYFTNPDNDPITYTLISAKNGEFAGTYTVNAEYHYMDIEAGLVPGTYEITITAADPEMKTPAECSFTLEVENRAPVLNDKIERVSLWSKFVPLLQKRENMDKSLDLNDYFGDPDGTILDYGFTVGGSDGVVEVTQDKNELYMRAQKPGSTVITVTAFDGYARTSTEFEVRVEKAWVRFFKDMGKAGIVLGISILILVLVGTHIYLKTFVTGEWEISITDGTKKLGYDRISARDTDVGKKNRKFALCKMLAEIKPYMRGDAGLRGSLDNSFLGGDRVKKIKMKGLYGKDGCKIYGFTGRSRDNTVVTVSWMGTVQNKAFTVTAGEYFEVHITLDDGRPLDIKMQLL